MFYLQCFNFIITKWKQFFPPGTPWYTVAIELFVLILFVLLAIMAVYASIYGSFLLFTSILGLIKAFFCWIFNFYKNLFLTVKDIFQSIIKLIEKLIRPRN